MRQNDIEIHSGQQLYVRDRPRIPHMRKLQDYIICGMINVYSECHSWYAERIHYPREAKIA